MVEPGSLGLLVLGGPRQQEGNPRPIQGVTCRLADDPMGPVPDGSCRGSLVTVEVGLRKPREHIGHQRIIGA